jgi:hypothetical protein
VTARSVRSTTLIRFLVVGTVRQTALRTSAASTAYDYIKHTHEMSRMNGATNALSIGHPAWYILFLVIVHVLLMHSHTHMHIHIVSYVTLVF